MRKLVSILLTLAVAVSLLVVPAMVSAADGDIEFAVVGDTATAGLTTEQARSGDYSVKFHAEAWGEDGYAMGISVDVPLNEFSGLSYWRNGMGFDYAPPAVLLCIDANNDGKLDFGTDDILSGDPSLLGDDAFIEIGADWIEPGWVEVDGFAGPVSGGWLYGGGSWTDKNGWSGYLTYSSLEEVIAAGGFLPSDAGDPCPIDPTDNVMLVVIAGGNPDFSALYIDDVIINGKTYDFEPNTTVGLTADTEEITAISVTPTDINFGTVGPGESVLGDTITVKNIGAGNIDVDANLDRDGTVFDYLQLNGAYSSGYSGDWPSIIKGLSPGTDGAVTTGLKVPATYSAKGEETAILVFTAVA